MFDPEQIFDAVTLLDPRDANIDALLLQLRGRTISIPGPQGFRPVRLPRDVDIMHPLRTIALADNQDIPGPMRIAALRRVLTAPDQIYPMTPPSSAGQRREISFLAAVGSINDPDIQAALLLNVAVTEDDRANPRVVHLDATAKWFLSPNDLEAALEQLYLQAVPGARRIPAHSTVLWLGGPPAQEDSSGWQDRVEAVGAVRSTAVPIRHQPGRYARDIANEFASKKVDLIVVWEPFAKGANDLAYALSERTGQPSKTLVEPLIDDCLVEFAWTLDEVIYNTEALEQADTGAPPPTSGEERFYIKHHGSGIGDKMLRVRECNHTAWGHDQQASAPRAYKGITQLEGVAPTSLFLCAKCTKHRWRARF